MKKANPLSSLRFLTVLICGLMGAAPIIALIEDGSLKDDLSGYAVFAFLGMSMAVIYSAVRSIDRRLSNIEQQLEQSGQ